MKKFLFYFVSFFSIYMNAQTTIVEEKFEKGNKPIEFQVLEKQNKLLVKKGKSYGSIRGINKVEILSPENPKQQLLVDNARFLNFDSSTIDDTFNGTEFNGVGWQADSKVYDGNKLIATIDNKKPILLFSKEFSYDVGNEKNEYVESLEKSDLFLHKYNLKTRKIDLIKLAKPSFLNVNKSDYFKLKDIKYKFFFHKESFDITTKFINKSTKSFILYRSIYDYKGNNIQNLSYDVNIEKPLIFSNNGGGGIGSAANGFSMASNQTFGSSTVDVFADQLSINNYYIDKETKDLYIYGLYGNKEDKLESSNVAGYYVVKFDANGNKIWQKVQEISDKEINGYSSKLRLNLDFEIVNNSIIFSLNKYAYDQYFFYSKIDINNGDILKTDKISFEVDKMGISEYRNTEIVAFFTLKEFKNLKFDMHTFCFLNDNKKIQSYLSDLDKSKKKISINSFTSDEGIWLIESDNKDYYKVTFFNN